ncbi:cadherin-related family member 5-like [Conger conger]|uniref:cadherin-related family member 5-like n=1 Tax=Conger conger TaxID=82655 RepID=UPI002A5AF19E|nr:cadherin-related family member 5-like [Conger conger]
MLQLQQNPGNFFKLQGSDVLINAPLDFESFQFAVYVRNVNDVRPEFAQSQYNLNIPEDNGSPPPPNVETFSATATVTITIDDVDNRPPWFQPCKAATVGSSKICLSSGYSGSVNLTEKTEGALPLEPGPVFAIDGDWGRNEQIIYQIMAGNEEDIFAIDKNTGNISMKKPADVPGPVVLTVLALQQQNSDRFSSISVRFDVVLKSLHLPQFQQQQYQGVVLSDSGPSSLVLESQDSDRPLRVQATDADFSDGINPNVRYTVEDEGSSFTVTAEGFVLLTRDVAPGNVSLRIRAVDTTNGEFGTATMSVETLPEAEPELPPPPGGRFRDTDMAALGASLGVLLLLSLLLVGLLLVHMKKGNAAWSKLSEASLFRSMLFRGSGGTKEGVQYTNGGFQNDGDTGSVTSDLPVKVDLALAGVLGAQAGEASREAQASLGARFRGDAVDGGSLAESDPADGEREVKPILTKERRMEEGYKSVWFKEDIDPNAKEEVRIIPDGGERDAEEEEEEEEEEEDEDASVDGEDGEDVSPPPTPSAFQTTEIDDSDL